jgi:hypothetical protein
MPVARTRQLRSTPAPRCAGSPAPGCLPASERRPGEVVPEPAPTRGDACPNRRVGAGHVSSCLTGKAPASSWTTPHNLLGFKIVGNSSSRSLLCPTACLMRRAEGASAWGMAIPEQARGKSARFSAEHLEPARGIQAGAGLRRADGVLLAGDVGQGLRHADPRSAHGQERALYQGEAQEGKPIGWSGHYLGTISPSPGNENLRLGAAPGMVEDPKRE